MEKKDIKKKTAKEAPASPYVFAVGRRKTAVARIKLFPEGKGEITVNQKQMDQYFPTLALQIVITSPLAVAGLEKKVNVTALASGGGKAAQADAMRLAISRALVKENADRKGVLKKHGLLTRDARKKERKKPGLKRARRAPQWQKR